MRRIKAEGKRCNGHPHPPDRWLSGLSAIVDDDLEAGMPGFRSFSVDILRIDQHGVRRDADVTGVRLAVIALGKNFDIEAFVAIEGVAVAGEIAVEAQTPHAVLRQADTLVRLRLGREIGDDLADVHCRVITQTVDTRGAVRRLSSFPGGAWYFRSIVLPAPTR